MYNETNETNENNENNENNETTAVTKRIKDKKRQIQRICVETVPLCVTFTNRTKNTEDNKQKQQTRTRAMYILVHMKPNHL